MSRHKDGNQIATNDAFVKFKANVSLLPDGFMARDKTEVWAKEFRTTLKLSFREMALLTGYQKAGVQKSEHRATSRYYACVQNLWDNRHLERLPSDFQVNLLAKKVNIDLVAGVRAKPEWRKCAWCGKTKLFSTKLSAYCSAKCKDAAKKSLRVKINAVQERIVGVECPTCRTLIADYRSHFVRVSNDRPGGEAAHDSLRYVERKTISDALPSVLRPTEGGVPLETDGEIPAGRDNRGSCDLQAGQEARGSNTSQGEA
jgi:endogenous inhibitor of DNA gyrase (YacG/DUF329 family)